jgi:tRNA pseudouridine55 synthase
MNGILLVDKPSGWTSFDVVNKVRHVVEQAGLNSTGRKRFPVGHTGTLDPLATGLLVLMLGTYTKKVPQYTKLGKAYEATMRLGQTSTTADEEGQKITVSNRRPTEPEIRQALAAFEGDIMQTPPAFSAIKVNGQRAYKLARQGKAPELEPRPVHIERITLVKYDYPEVQLVAEVSSGTYIRSLVADIGERLGTGAYMSALRRISIGQFSIEEAIDIKRLTPQKIAELLITQSDAIV